MQTISFTQLRTHSNQLKRAIDAGETVKLTHRSRTLANIKPDLQAPKPFDANKMKKIVEAMNLPKLTYKQMERNYRQHLEEKYGKYIPRHK